MHDISLNEIIKGFKHSLKPYDYSTIQLLLTSDCSQEAIENLVRCLLDEKVPINQDAFEALQAMVDDDQLLEEYLNKLEPQIINDSFGRKQSI